MRKAWLRGAGTLAAGPFRWLAQHQAICLIVFCSFVARLFLADWNSYWYDEILSVVRYGTDNATVSSALKTLATKSAHPPLYHVILFYWLQLFGDSEVATRTLSNLYIAGATFCLYVLALKLWGRRVAIASALIFAFSYTAILYGQEVRSYPQSLFLVTLSSLLLLRWLEQLDRTQPWRGFFTGRGAALFLCNVALLLTHYSNALFLLVQALFAGFILWHQKPSARYLPLTKAAVFYVLQFATAFAIWGPVALATRRRFQDDERYVIDGLPTQNPLSIFMDLVVRPNFDLAWILYLVLLVLLATVLAKIAIRYFVRARGAPPLNAYFLFYLVGWAMLPCVAGYLLFFASGVERYSVRYFAFCFPPLCILLVLAIEQSVESLNAARSVFGFSISRHYLRNALLYALVICLVFALPGGYKAATREKDPFREIARSIVMLVEGDRKSSFAIYEAGWGQPWLNYYMQQMSKRVRVDGMIKKTDEDRGRDPLGAVEKTIAGKDYLVVAFPHLRTKQFPRLMRRLKKDYNVEASQLNKGGKGFIVLKPHAKGKRTSPP